MQDSYGSEALCCGVIGAGYVKSFMAQLHISKSVSSHTSLL